MLARDDWIKYGIFGGIVAGIVFAMFEMITAAVLDGADAFFMPLRMIGGMGLGAQALDPNSTSLVVAGGAGIVIHMILSMIFGVIIAAILALVASLSSSSSAVLVSASVGGLVLWIVNFYVIAGIFGWIWFPNSTNPVVQVVAHTLFYGTVLGIVLDRTLFRHATTGAMRTSRAQ